MSKMLTKNCKKVRFAMSISSEMVNASNGSSTGEPLAKRMKKMMAKDTYADVHFLVGKSDEKEKVFAHKNVLAESSDVFEKMFPFDAVNSNFGTEANPVVVSDIDADVFKVMLSYIYSDDLSELNGENAMELLYAANKYNICLLVNACLDFPISELANVFHGCVQARIFGKNDFAKRCLDYIYICAETLFQTDAFLEIDQKLLRIIFGRDQLEIGGEMAVWEAALSWADAQCRKQDKDCTAENRRAVLGSALHKIRFPLVPRKEFSNKIVPSGILTKDELIAVYQYHCQPGAGLPAGLCPHLFPTRGRVSDRHEARLVLDIDKLTEFAQKANGTARFSPDIYVQRLPWTICAQIIAPTAEEGGGGEKWLGIFLNCAAPRDGPNWSCKCSATVRIVSQKSGTEDLTRKLTKTLLYNNESNSWGFANYITFEDLMSSDKGLYDKEEDKITLTIDVYDVSDVVIE